MTVHSKALANPVEVSTQLTKSPLLVFCKSVIDVDR